jgi:vancomycin resistance protein YoaR
MSGAVTEPTETPGRPGGLHDPAGQGAHRARRGEPAPQESGADPAAPYRTGPRPGADREPPPYRSARDPLSPLHAAGDFPASRHAASQVPASGGSGSRGGPRYDPPSYDPPGYDTGRYDDSGRYDDTGRYDDAGRYDPGLYDLDFPPVPPAPPSLDLEPAAERTAPARPPAGAAPTVQDGGMRLVTDAEATARLRIRLPDSMPQPATTLRPHATWEDRRDEDVPDGVPRPRGAADAAPFAQVAASPARPSALPSELAALTTATLVVPLPPDARPTPALLTTTLPPNNAAQANAALLVDAFHDTMEEIFGIDLDAVDRAALGPAGGAAAGSGPRRPDAGTWYDEDGDEPLRPDGAAFAGDRGPRSGRLPAQYVPGAVPAAAFGGAYGVPTQPASFRALTAAAPALRDPARHALALRYLGGIFHDSSGESSYLDPGGLDPGALAFVQAAEAPTEMLSKVPAAATALLPAQRPGPGPARPAPGAGSRRHTRPARPAPGRPAPPAPGEPSSRRGRPLLIGTLALAGIALLYGVALLVAGGVLGGTVPRGTVVSGIPIGGMNPAAAELALSQGLGPNRIPLQVDIGQDTVTVDPATSGVGLDPAATVAAAESRRTDPFTVIPALFGSTRRLAPVLSVDPPRLTAALTRIAAVYDIPMVEGRITFDGTDPVVTQPSIGRGFSVPDAVSAVRTGYLRVDGPIVIPAETLTPRATPAALQAALEHLARPAVAAPMTLTTGSTSMVLSPDRIGAVLTIVPNEAGQMVAQVDGAALRSGLPAAALAQEQPAIDASFTIKGGAPDLVSGRDGRGFAPAALAAAVGAHLAAPAPRTAVVPLGDLPPAFTTEDAQALGVTDILGTATLAVPAAPDRAATVQRAADRVTGSVVQPGQTWSFLATLGPLDAADGFPAVPATGSVAGTDPSGGVDTVATAVFEAAFASGMGDTLHHPHAVYASRFPIGLDAAVSAPGDDLRWTDTGSHPVFLYAAYADGTLTVALLGEKSYDQVKVEVSHPYTTVTAGTSPGGAPCTARPAVNGFQVDVTRVLSDGGSQVGSEQYHVTYQPQNGIGCGSASPGSPSAGGSPPPSSSSGSGGSGPTRGPGPGSPPPAPAPSPTTGALGGLL